MKFLRFVLPFVVVFSLLISACAPMSNEVILPPGDVNNVGLVTGVDNSKTAQELYNDCVQEAVEKAAWTITVQISNQPVVVTGCQTAPIDQADLLLVPAMRLTKIVPGQGDDIIVYGVATIKEIAYILIGTATIIAAGEIISVNIQKATGVLMFASIQTTHGTTVWYAHNGGCWGGIQSPSGKRLETWVDGPCPTGPTDTKGIVKLIEDIRKTFDNKTTGYSWEKLLKDDIDAATALQAIAEDWGIIITIP